MTAQERRHPTVVVLDRDGAPVTSSGRPASPIRTCDGCHDAPWIAASAHHDLGQGAEHDCFVCHVEGADAAARARELEAARPEWAATATLSKVRGPLQVGRPTTTHCVACHDETDTTGQRFSGQLVADSDLNLRDKDAQLRPWDVHAARMVDCSTCHVSPNHPGARDDPRRVELGEYLRRPSHARGAVRSCEDCHEDATSSHARWLPYAARHTERLRCEACHVPRALVPARAEVDEEGVVHRRGGDEAAWEGFEPVLLARAEEGGRVRLGPYNLVTTWRGDAGEVRAHALHHGVVAGRHALRECDACHAPDGRLGRPFLVARAPARQAPSLVGDVVLPPLERDEAGAWVVRPRTADVGAWVVGHDRAPLVDALGAAAVLLTLAAAVSHGLGRVVAARRRA